MTDTSQSDIIEIIARHRDREGSLLPMLHDIQHQFGYVPEAALPLLADALNITRAEVHGVISFYHDFRDKPAGKHIIKICRAEACQAQGANALADEIIDRLGLNWGDTSHDNRVTLEPVFCLGLCANGPCAMVNDKLKARTTADAILAEVGA